MLKKGQIYRFDQSDASNASHPLRLSKTADGTHGGGSEYTINLTVLGTADSAAAYVQIAIACDAQTLYIYRSNHNWDCSDARKGPIIGKSGYGSYSSGDTQYKQFEIR